MRRKTGEWVVEFFVKDVGWFYSNAAPSRPCSFNSCVKVLKKLKTSPAAAKFNNYRIRNIIEGDCISSALLVWTNS